MPTDDIAAIAHLDFTEVHCQCEQLGCEGKCPNPATVHVEFHAIDHCNVNPEEGINIAGNYTFLLCVKCLAGLASAADRHVKRLNRYGRGVCLTCGAPMAAAQPDVIRGARKL